MGRAGGRGGGPRGDDYDAMCRHGHGPPPRVRAKADSFLLTHSSMGIQLPMARATTTSDVFNAIAEPRRRQIIETLARHEPCSVGELVEIIELPQPSVSKHLGVLREVGLVVASDEGRHRLYRLDATQLTPVRDWINSFEQFWSQQLDQIKHHAERTARTRPRQSHTPESEQR